MPIVVHQTITEKYLNQDYDDVAKQYSNSPDDSSPEMAEKLGY